MFSCEKIPSVEYYLRSEQRRSLDYYTNADASAVWWTPYEANAAQFGCCDRERIDPETFRRIATGTLADGRKAKRKNGVRNPGFDLHFAPPKSVSIVALLSDRETRKACVRAHDEAVRSTLQFIYDHGFLKSRRGHGGAIKEAPGAYVAAVFRELTSRENDPQLHSHAVVPNIGIRSDGTVGALEFKELFELQRLVGAVYGAELSSRLIHLGFQPVRRERTFELSGVPQTVIDAFSKRRQKIKEAARRLQIDITKDRAAAELLTLSTRPRKQIELTADQLEIPWQNELAALGFDFASVERKEILTAVAPMDANVLASESVQEVFDKSAVVKRADVLGGIAEHLQCAVGAAEISPVLSRALETLVVRVHKSGKENEDLMSSVRNVELERSLIRVAKFGFDRWDKIDTEIVDAAIVARPTLSDEQKAAVRHGLNADLIAVIKGSAGAGKSFGLGALVDAARRAGKTVHALAPSWAAAKVIGRETDTPIEKVHALTGFLLALEAGKTRLGPSDVVILDEAGMSPTADLTRLAQATAEAGAKLVLSGDPKQLQPVGAGAPLKIVERVLGSSAMLQIRRQSLGWQRDASMLFAKGMASTALGEYEKRGHIEWLRGTDQAIQAAADRFLADRLWDEATVTRPQPTSLAIAAWNSDVHELNHEIRVRLQASGIISEMDIEIPVASRDKETDEWVEGSILLAKGDRIAFTETVRHSEREIRNADAATVIEVDKTGATFRFDDGQTISAKYSRLVGRRSEGQPKHPSIKHIFAVTAHFAQGLTVDRAYVLGTRNMTRESIYVAMTRHRHSVQLFVDADRVRPVPVPGNPLSEFLDPDKKYALSAEADLAGRKAAFFVECDRPAEKWNASDFAADPMAWAIDGPAPGPAGNQQSLSARIRSRARLRLGESAIREEAPPAAGIPNSEYKLLRDRYRRAFSISSTKLSPILNWVSWLRRQLQSMAWTQPTPDAPNKSTEARINSTQLDEGPTP